MNVELMKRMMDACYLAQRVRGMLPTLPEGVTPSYIHYLDIIEMLEKQGVRAKISDISDALDLPRPGVTRTVKAMEAKGYLKKAASSKDGRVTYLSYRSRQGTVSYLQRTVFYHSRLFYGRYPGRRCEMYDPHHRCSTSDYV